MSQFPPPPPPDMSNPYDSSLPYATPAPKTSGMALAAMILGIVSIPLMCFGIGIVTAIIAIILGIISLGNINKNPQMYSGKGFAIAGIATGAGGAILLLLLIAILLPSLGKARELPNRSVCAANLRGISQSMVVYSADNNDSYPYMGPAAISPQPPLATTDGGLMHDMYNGLVVSGMVAPKQFLCKSDPANTCVSTASTTVPAYPYYAPEYWTNPGSAAPGAADRCYSYSFAYQYAAGPTGKPALAPFWRNTVDAASIIAADMNPGANLLPGKSIYNSLNHQGDGQNVIFADAHAEFVRTPCAGAGGDNIYNTGSKANGPGTSGTMPPATPGGPGAYDTDLSPMILNTTDYKRQ